MRRGRNRHDLTANPAALAIAVCLSSNVRKVSQPSSRAAAALDSSLCRRAWAFRLAVGFDMPKKSHCTEAIAAAGKAFDLALELGQTKHLPALFSRLDLEQRKCPSASRSHPAFSREV